jgi:hypothetical protein
VNIVVYNQVLASALVLGVVWLSIRETPGISYITPHKRYIRAIWDTLDGIQIDSDDMGRRVLFRLRCD